MPLMRSDSQGGGSVAEHYRDDPTLSKTVRDFYRGMRELVDALSNEFPSTNVWAITSMDSLGLMSIPEFDEGENHVLIERYYDGCYHMRYFPPKGELPIPESWIAFTAVGLQEAVSFVKIAMRASGGWPDGLDLRD